MDNKREKIEESTQQTALISPATTTPTTSNATNILTTSKASSDSLESWTLVNKKEKCEVNDDLDDDNDNRIETFKNSDNDEEQEDTESEQETETEPEREPDTEPELQDSANDFTNEELSDGISVISESESVGRMSTHGYTGEYMKFSLNEIGNEVRQRRRISTEGATVALQKSSQTVIPASGIVSLAKRGFKGIFYVGVLLALLGLIGRIINPTWKPLSTFAKSSPNVYDLQQKVNDMELQNRLMSAEIDLINKKVKHLSSHNEQIPQQQKPSNYKEHKESETFKAWPGNGDSIKPVDITKEDLKEPYKAPEKIPQKTEYEKFRERRKNWPKEPDRLMTWFLRQGKRFNNFEELDAELRKFQDYEYIIEQFEFIRKEIEKERNGEYGDYAVYMTSDSKETHGWKNEMFGDNTPKEKKHRKGNSKERFTKDYNDSKENSKENDSKENYNKQKRKYVKKYGADFNGEWQDNYMKHREQKRKQNDEKYQNNKNWYIKRADSRENKRSGEKKYR